MNLLKALATVSGMTLLSRLTGLAREFLIARSFGASIYTDAFFVAFKIPNLLRRLFAEGAFSQAFVPILAEYKNQHGEAATRDLIDHVAGCLLMTLLVTAATGVALAGVIVYGLAPGFARNPAQYQAAVDMLRITFPYIVMISLVALAAGVLNTWRRFMAPAFAPVLLNLSFIGCILWLAPHLERPVMALAWAVVLGGLAQLALQAWALKRVGLLPRFRFNWRHTGVARVLKQMAPAVFGVSVAQLSLIINGILASLLVTGSVSWLYYADRLMEFPTGMLGVALGTIILPSLSKHHGDDNRAEYSRLLDWGLRLACLLALPAALALALLATPLVTTMYHYGKFSAADVSLTHHALVAYSVGLVGLIAVKVLAPGFYARQDIKTPVRIAIITLVFSQALSLVLMWLLPSGFQHAGLAFAIGMGACLNALLLLRGLRSSNGYQPQPGWAAFLAKLAVALLVMGAALWLISPVAAHWLAMQATPWLRVGWLLGVCAAGAAAYGATLLLLGFRPRDFRRVEA
jgi:putative peptidoglycan lipid II flippase